MVTSTPIKAGPVLHIATNALEVIEAWQLLYQVYIGAGYIQANPFGLHTAPEAIGPQSLVLTACQNDLAVSTITCMADSSRGLPLDSAYPQELEEMRRQNRQMVEVGLFGCIDERSSFATIFDLLRYSFYYSIGIGADDIICGIPPRRMDLYAKLMGFEQIGPVKTYSTVKDNPVVLMRGHIATMLENQARHRAVAYSVKNPLDPSFFDCRFDFSSRQLSGTFIDQYLQAKGYPAIDAEDLAAPAWSKAAVRTLAA